MEEKSKTRENKRKVKLEFFQHYFYLGINYKKISTFIFECMVIRLGSHSVHA